MVTIDDHVNTLWMHSMCNSTGVLHSWVNRIVGNWVSNDFLFLIPHMHFPDPYNEASFCFTKADECFKKNYIQNFKIK